MVIVPAVDRLSRDTTDLPVIAREMQRKGAGIPPGFPPWSFVRRIAVALPRAKFGQTYPRPRPASDAR